MTEAGDGESFEAVACSLLSVIELFGDKVVKGTAETEITV